MIGLGVIVAISALGVLFSAAESEVPITPPSDALVSSYTETEEKRARGEQAVDSVVSHFKPDTLAGLPPHELSRMYDKVVVFGDESDPAVVAWKDEAQRVTNKRLEKERAERHAKEKAERIERIRAMKIGDDCRPPLRWVKNRLEKNPEWPDDVIAATTCNWVRIGMTKEQAIAGWGRPSDINRSVYSFGVHEQWVYGEYGERGYLYFEDGVLTALQN